MNPLRAGAAAAVVIAFVVAGPLSSSRSQSVPYRHATVTGYVRLCGGPAPGRCFIGTFGVCQPPVGCVTTDRVAA
jgi:hypothetical protein